MSNPILFDQKIYFIDKSRMIVRFDPETFELKKFSFH